MSLPWVRLDSNIASHDKILALLAKPNGAKAFVLYVSALGYAGGHGTDGRIARHTLAMIHGTAKLAEMLIEQRLWEYDPEGGGSYLIYNYADRQELAFVTEQRKASQRRAARRTNCRRWHIEGCECWKKPDPTELTTD